MPQPPITHDEHSRPPAASRSARGVDRQALLAAVLALLALGFVQTATPHPIGVDGLFHTQSARQIGENLPRPWMAEFRWLEHTSLRHDRFADFYWGFHLLLVPLTVLPLEAAAKVAPVLATTASLLALYFVLLRLGVRYRLLWFAIALLSSPIFLMRMSQTKAPTVMLGLLLLVAWAIVSRRSAWIAATSAAATWVYPVLPLLCGVAGAALAAGCAVERRVPWRAALAVAGGIVAGLVIHPNFPRNVPFLIVNLTDAASLQAGEFSPLRTDTFLLDLWLPMVLFVLAFRWARFERGATESRATWAFFLSASVLLVVAARFMRGIDFVPPFVVVFTALALDRPLGLWVERWRSAPAGPFAKRLVATAATIAVLVAAGAQLARARSLAARNSSAVAHRLAGAARWLADHTAPQELVLNLSAGDFEQLWAYNTHNTYWVGFNVLFLERESPVPFAEYARVYERGDLSALLRLLTGGTSARYALASDRLPGPLLQAIASSPALEVVYSDRSCVIVKARA